MDTELRFIASLLRAKRSQQENFYSKHIPKGVFRVRTQEIDWVFRFREKYGTYPTTSDYRAKFKDRLPQISSPLDAVIQPVLDFAMYAQMRDLGDKVKKMFDAGESTTKALALYKEGASKLTSYSTDYVDIDINDDEGADDRYRALVAEKAKDHPRILTTPWPTLNRLISYMSIGEQALISARYALGKSWVVSCWADYLASLGFNVGVFSKEMPGRQFQDRIECLRFGVNYVKFREGDLSPRELRRWRTRKADAQKRKDYVLKVFGNEDAEGGLGFTQIAAKTRQYGLEVCFVDGAYLIRPPELRADIGDVQRFTYLSNHFKHYAKLLEVLFVCTLQDNRGAEDKKGNTKGGATTIYGADAWGQDADWHLSIGGRRGAPEREIALNKGRESALGEFRVGFNLTPPSFSDMGPGQMSPLKSKIKSNSSFKGVT